MRLSFAASLAWHVNWSDVAEAGIIASIGPSLFIHQFVRRLEAFASAVDDTVEHRWAVRQSSKLHQGDGEEVVGSLRNE